VLSRAASDPLTPLYLHPSAFVEPRFSAVDSAAGTA
jgi:hypothetical protein